MIDHLWQSTLFAAVMGLLTLAFRNHGAHVRHGLWLAASLKFIVPFSALAAIGARLAWLLPVPEVRLERVMVVANGAPPPGGPAFFDRMIAPPPPVVERATSEWLALAPGVLVSLWAAGAAVVLALWAVRWLRTARVAAAAMPLTDGRELDLLRSVERRLGMRRPLRLSVTDGALEPGVFGIIRPVLLWPRSIGNHLTDDQIEAVIAHELAHVRRRDNLQAVLHTLVQAAFWFHPLVWWIGARLVDERERACDEQVIGLGSRPHVYAESILRTCQFYVEAPAACMAGVTGSDLKRRIEQIMRHVPRQPVGGGRKALLAMTALLTILVPMAAGAVTAAPARLQAVRVARPDAPARQIMFHRPGGPFRVSNFTVRELIRFAYSIPDEYIFNAPAWIDTERFDIEMPWNEDPSAGEVQELVRNMLALQFRMNSRMEKRPMPAYVLTRTGAELGPQLRPATGDCTVAPPTGVAGVEPCDMRRDFDGFPNSVYVRGVTMAQFAEALNRDGLVRLDRPVVDRTGLPGRYDAQFGFLRGPHRGRDSLANRLINAVMSTFGYPDVFDALEQQLGLKLEAQDAPVDVLVLDRIVRPAN